MNQNEGSLDGLRPDVKEYLLFWKETAYTAAVTLAAAAWICGLVRFALRLGGAPLELAIRMCIPHGAAALAGLLSCALVPHRQAATLSLTAFCAACAMPALGVGVVPEMLVLGGAGGFAMASLLHTVMALRRLRGTKGAVCPLTACAGLAIAAGTAAAQISVPIVPVCFMTVCAVGAAGIHLKFCANPSIPPCASDSLRDLLAVEYTRRERMELGLQFLTYALAGAAAVFVFPGFPCLLLLLGAVPWREKNPMALLLLGSTAAMAAGIFLLWHPDSFWGMTGFVFGLFLTVRYTERVVLPRHPQRAGIILAQISCAAIAGILLAGVSFSSSL